MKSIINISKGPRGFAFLLSAFFWGGGGGVGLLLQT